MKIGDTVRLNEKGRSMSQKSTHNRLGKVIKKNPTWGDQLWWIEWEGRKKPQTRHEDLLEVVE